jgi:hypothetical protein
MRALFTRVRRRLTFANVTSGLALFVALGGTSYAAITLPANSVGSSQIRTGAVHKAEIATSAVGKSEVRTSAIGKSELATNGVGKGEIRKDAVGTSEIKDGEIQAADLSETARTAFTLGRAAVNTGGTLVAGNAKAVTHTAASGVYTVDFGRDVSACQYSATLANVKNGTTVDAPTTDAGRIQVSAGGANTQVVVSTFNNAPAATDEPFNLLVAC